MNRNLILFPALLLASACSISSSVSQAAVQLDCPEIVVRPGGSGVLGDCFGTVAPPTDTPTPTETSIPPTDTPVPPTDTPVPSGHDDVVWHSPAEAEVFGYEHGSDPNSVNDIFGEPGCWFGNCGQSISYPFETPNENATKHEVYTWIVRRDLPKIGRTGVSRDPYVKAFRLQSHFTGGAFGVDGGPASGGYMTRFHSFSLEAQLCRQADDACGTVAFAGFMDTGCLKLRDPDTGESIQHCLPGEEDAEGENENLRWRAHGLVAPLSQAAIDRGRKVGVLWYGKLGKAGGPPFRRVAMNIETSDSSVWIDRDNIGTLHLVCPEFDCHLNNSTIRVHRWKIQLHERDYLDPDGNGLVSQSGFLNTNAQLNPDCTEVSAACIPYIVQNAPLGKYSYEPGLQLPPDEPRLLEFDISPTGEFWIRHPN